VQRVGSLELRHVNVCVIAATNRDLRAEVAAGRFRSDLFYRLNVVEVPLPPLRDRREDIPYLTASFVKEFAARMQKPITGVTPSAERILLEAPWEGNVRELRNVIERACILTETSLITDRELAGLPTSAAAPPRPHPVIQPAPVAAPDESLSRLEREHILRMLQQAGGNKKAAAQLLGVSRRALYRRLERHGLDRVIEHRRPGAHEDSGPA
jgi:DNA-binding NtrC family response regulator